MAWAEKRCDRRERNNQMINQFRDQLVQQIEGEDDVMELSFENLEMGEFTPDVAKLLKPFNQLSCACHFLLLVSLEFSNCKLARIELMPSVRGVIKLVLDNNQLDGDALKTIAAKFKGLQYLSLVSNRIARIPVPLPSLIPRNSNPWPASRTSSSSTSPTTQCAHSQGTARSASSSSRSSTCSTTRTRAART